MPENPPDTMNRIEVAEPGDSDVMRVVSAPGPRPAADWRPGSATTSAGESARRECNAGADARERTDPDA